MLDKEKVMMMTNTIARITIDENVNCPGSCESRFNWLMIDPRVIGSDARIPIVMIKLMPFPIPRSVICSPTHMRNSVPAVIADIMTR